MRGPDLSEGELQDRFSDLTALLAAHRHLWAPRPFSDRSPPWEADHREVADWLRQQSRVRLDALDRRPYVTPADMPSSMRAWRRATARQARLASWAGPDLAALEDPALGLRVPDRKWRQIRAFVGALVPALPARLDRAVDWCAGKGHLGRAVRRATRLPVDLLERRADLCAAGAHLAAAQGLDGCRFVTADVMENGDAHLAPNTVGIGLHACGDLWRRLLDDAATRGASAVVAPCCYHHLGGAPVYTPRSRAGLAADLGLSQPQLRLAVAEERVARPAVLTARRREQAWRLGFDLLVREASGEDRYRAQGPFPKAMFDLAFEAFCHAAAERLQRQLPSAWRPDLAEAAGWQRAHEVVALTMVRSTFRRPMELWLVLDAALAQVERGRRVRLGTFCSPALTPRNLILVSTP